MRPAGKAKTGAKDKSLAVTLLLKATAQHSLLLREATSTIWKVWIMDAEDFVAKKVMDSMREYAKATREQGKGHKLGGGQCLIAGTLWFGRFAWGFPQR